MANKPGFDTDTGRGGETHQRVPKRGSHGAEGHLTTNQESGPIRVLRGQANGIDRSS